MALGLIVSEHVHFFVPSAFFFFLNHNPMSSLWFVFFFFSVTLFHAFSLSWVHIRVGDHVVLYTFKNKKYTYKE